MDETKIFSKQQARSIISARFSQMTPSKHLRSAEGARQRLANLLRQLEQHGKLRTILSYQALLKWHEVDLVSLESEFSGARFDYAPADSNAPFPLSVYDVVLVPLYGFNEDGYRLGHGAGWYDRLLSQQPGAVKIGIGLEEGRIGFAVEGHDVPMDVVVTERRAVTYAARARS